MTTDQTAATADPAEARTFPAFVRAIARAYGDSPAVTFTSGEKDGDSISFAELDRVSAALARGLLARGVGKGSRIGFIAGNGPRFAVLLAAIARIGAVAIPVSTLLKANELVRVLRQSDVAGLIVERRLFGKDYVERLREALPALDDAPGPSLFISAAPYLRWIVSDGAGLPPGIGDTAALEAEGAAVSDDVLRAVEAEVHTTDQMIEIYTSGAMALPKGVKHNHGPVMFRAHYMRRMLRVQRGDAPNAALPMFWVGGLMMALLPNLAAGATTVCSEKLLASSQVAMGSVLAAEDLALMRRQPTIWALGMTETLGPYSYGDELRATGYPLCAPIDHVADGFEVRVVDEAGRPVADGECGEMQVRGLALTPGIHKVERPGYFEPDGFYRTGDLCEVQGGRILFVGRGGDMIKTASSNVSPAEVEAEMQQLDGVHSAYVVGLPDKERGQLVVAAVVPREGARIDVDELQAQLKQRLSSFKVPRAIVVITRDEVPLLFSNKVGRRLLEQLLAAKLGR